MNSEELSIRLWKFAARACKVVDALPDTRVGRHVAGQLVRSGTSSPPNYDESCAAESRDDFTHRLSIALKELKETRGWLNFIPMAELLPVRKVSDLLDECGQLIKIPGKSVPTAKAKNRRPREEM
jgi:four helix bundle protein